MNNLDELFEQLKERWPSSIVARKDMPKFSGGLVSAGTCANADSEGTGPEDRFYLGRSAAYGVNSAIAWMKKRIKTDRLPAVDRTNRGHGRRNRK